MSQVPLLPVNELQPGLGAPFSNFVPADAAAAFGWGAEEQLQQMLARVAPSFLLTILSDEGVLTTETFPTLLAMQARMTELVGQDVTLVPSVGVRLGISRGPMRHLVTPIGNHPLFAAPPPELDLEDDGFVGRRLPIGNVPEDDREPEADVVDGVVIGGPPEDDSEPQLFQLPSPLNDEEISGI